MSENLSSRSSSPGRLGDTACYDVDTAAGSVHLRLQGELDAANADELLGVILAEGIGATDRVVADLHEVRFIDSRGLSALLHAQRELGVRFVLGRRSERVARILEITGLGAAHGPWPAPDGDVRPAAT
jgi:anti-anti-sigma factor